MDIDKCKLAKIFADYPLVIDDRVKFVGILRDHFPMQKLDCNVIINAYDLDIVEEIRNNDLNESFISRFVKKMEKAYGIKSQIARESVIIWCEAYGKSVLKKELLYDKDNHGLTPAPVNTPKSAPAHRPTYTYPSYNSGGGTYSGYAGYRIRRRRKKIIIIAAIIIAILALVIGLVVWLSGGSGSSTINLVSPSSLCVDNGQITWSSVDNASSYVVKINNKEETVSTNSFSLSTSYDAGTYVISVKAQGSSDNIIESSYSDEIKVVKPESVSNISLSGNTLYWDAVSGYSSYRIMCNGNELDTVQSNLYSLADNSLKMEAGQNELAIIVAGDNSSVVDSNSSDIVTITKLSTPLNVVVSDDTLSWQNVSGAYSYIINITGGTETITITVESDVNSYYLLGMLEKGEYQITIQAIGNDSNVLSSNVSSGYTYTLAETVIGVSTVEDLKNIASDLTAKYVLQNDIDISGEDWTPIGSISSRFEGVFIGNGYSIIGLSLTSQSTKGSGFFGVVGESGIICDINFMDVNISGGTTGYVGAVAGVNYGTVFEVTVSGAVGTDTSGDNVGGLIGRNFGSIYNCVNKATVKGGTNVGGIAGNFEFNNANMTFSNCSNEGVIEGQARVGGLVGYIKFARLTYIDSLTNSGSVSALGYYVGGICGYLEGVSGQTGNLESCSNTADVVGADYVGGCFGYVGNYINITISNVSDTSTECTNTGNITATTGSNKGNIQGN